MTKETQLNREHQQTESNGDLLETIKQLENEKNNDQDKQRVLQNNLQGIGFLSFFITHMNL